MGYNNTNDPKTYPRRILGAGKTAGFTFGFRVKKNSVDYGCKTNEVGFRMALHTPDEIPRMSEHYLSIGFDTTNLISIKPHVMSTSKNLREYSSADRKCYMQTEKNLTFFRSYTQSNCKLECMTDYILKECKCVKFFMPHKNGTKICNPSEIICVENAKRSWIMRVRID